MRSFARLAPRQLRARRLRALLTAAGIVLGVGDDPRRPVAQRRRSSAPSPTSSTPSTGAPTSSSRARSRRARCARRRCARCEEAEGVEDAAGGIPARFNLIEKAEREEPPEPPPGELPEGAVPAARPPGARRGRGRRRAPQLAGRAPDDRLHRRRDRRGPRARARQRDRSPGELGRRQRHRGRRPASGSRRRGDRAARGRGAVPVRDRARLRRRGLRDDAARRRPGPDGRAARLRRDPASWSRAARTRSPTCGAGSSAGSSEGAKVDTPDEKADEVESQLQAFNVILYFFAAMALFVGGFLIFNSFNMTVLQRIREIGMLRTLGATRGMVTRSVLIEAALLALIGAVLGLGLGFAARARARRDRCARSSRSRSATVRVAGWRSSPRRRRAS